MKPDWKDAPSWAQWLAMDAAGIWFWHEREPQPTGSDYWFSAGQYQAADQWTDWKTSKESRP